MSRDNLNKKRGTKGEGPEICLSKTTNLVQKDSDEERRGSDGERLSHFLADRGVPMVDRENSGKFQVKQLK